MRYLSPFILLLLLSVGCTQKQQTGEPQETALSGTAEILCDQEIIDLLAPAKRIYDSVHPDANVTLLPTLADAATFELLRHQARGIVIARDWLPDEAAYVLETKGAEGYLRSLIARDALVFYASKQFPYDTMHSDHIRSWLGGQTFPMTSYPKLKSVPYALVPGSASSVYGNVVNVVLRGQQPSKDAVRTLRTRDSVRAAVRSHAGYIGIGYMSEVRNDTSVKMLRLSWTDSLGVYHHPRVVHAANLVQGFYPFPVPIYIVLRDRAHQYSLPSGFMMFIARDGKAQRTFFDAGIEPGYAKIVLKTED